ncbi:MAG: hypothetical protein ABIR55_09425 [Burkholderiaceae bacterium]
MIISLIDGTERPADDPQILVALRRAGARDPIFGASVLIAINNAEGETYRLVQCQGMRQAESVTQCLRGMGFVQTFAMGSPFHYTFRR